MANVERRHRELAYRALYPEAHESHVINYGAGKPALSYDDHGILARIAQAIADSESRGAQSRPTSSPPSAEPSRDRAAWAVAVLDAYAEKHDEAQAPQAVFHRYMHSRVGSAPARRWTILVDGHIEHFESAAAARIAAAEALVASDPSLNVQPEPSGCACHSCEVLPQLHEQVAQMCEYLGSKRDEVPCDSWHLRDLIVKLRARVPSGDTGQGDGRDVWVVHSPAGIPVDVRLSMPEALGAVANEGETAVRYVPASVPEGTVHAQAAVPWKKLHKADGYLAVDEGESYLFALEVSTKGFPPHWEYFSDGIVWDSETEPQWADGQHGWDLEDEIWFAPLGTKEKPVSVVLPPPPAPEKP